MEMYVDVAELGLSLQLRIGTQRKVTPPAAGCTSTLWRAQMWLTRHCILSEQQGYLNLDSASTHRSTFLYCIYICLLLPPFTLLLFFSSSYLPWRERRGLNNPHPQGWRACIAHRGRLPPFVDASCVPISGIFDFQFNPISGFCFHCCHDLISCCEEDEAVGAMIISCFGYWIYRHAACLDTSIPTIDVAYLFTAFLVITRLDVEYGPCLF
ncbi:hypothetical protein F5Y03DRAFT_269277 [Xylaria venustula]|nr:hypothetical protein F5Y03DRAFT_269277 [Xylaria venustula]